MSRLTMSPPCERPAVGDPVADDLVHRGADGLRESAVVERAGIGAKPQRLGVGDLVEAVGGDAGPDRLARHPQHPRRRGAGSPHARELVRRPHVGAPGARAPGHGVLGAGDVAGDGPAGRDHPGPEHTAGRGRRDRTGAQVGVQVAPLVLLAAPAPAGFVSSRARARGRTPGRSRPRPPVAQQAAEHAELVRPSGRRGNLGTGRAGTGRDLHCTASALQCRRQLISREHT